MNYYTKFFGSLIDSLLLYVLFFSTTEVVTLYGQFGGSTEINETSTGYFRSKKRGDIHSFVTLNGNGFRSMDVNHMHTQSSNNYDAIIEKY